MTQCPGECYDDFWENVLGDNEPALNIEELTKGKHWNGTEWVEATTRYRIDYFKEGDLERRWKYLSTMEKAVAKAHAMVQFGGYTIDSISPEGYP